MFRNEMEMILICAVLFALALFFAAGEISYTPPADDTAVFEPAEPSAPEEPADPVEVPPEEPAEPEPEPAEGGFSYYAAGDLKSGSGIGVNDVEIYAPDILFPVETAEAFLNSQYFNHGGGGYSGEGADGGRCAPSNYEYPWRDNFCETRWNNSNTRNCEKPQVHSGVDIRVGSAADCLIEDPKPMGSHTDVRLIAPEDGYISYVGNFYFKLNSGSRIYTFLHVNMDDFNSRYDELDDVSKGDFLGFASNEFTAKTTIHLHLNLRANIAGEGWVFVSPYMSMVRAYEARDGVTGTLVSD